MNICQYIFKQSTVKQCHHCLFILWGKRSFDVILLSKGLQSPTLEVPQNSNYLFSIILTAWGFNMSSFSHNLYWERRIKLSILLSFFVSYRKLFPFWVCTTWTVHLQKSNILKSYFTAVCQDCVMAGLTVPTPPDRSRVGLSYPCSLLRNIQECHLNFIPEASAEAKYKTQSSTDH